MQMKFYSPLAADFFPNEPDYEDEFYDEYEGCPLDGHDLLQYADAVDEAVKKDIADFNGDLMQYYHEDDSVRSKVVSAVPSVEICGNKLCGCLTVELKEPLLDDEQTVLCNYISGQYSDGWGEGFEQRDIRVDDGTLAVHFWQEDGFKMTPSFEKIPKPEKNSLRPKMQLIGQDGNVFAIMVKERSESDSEKTMSFFMLGVEQGIFRSDVNFAIVNLLVREQFDVLLNTDVCNEYSFIEVYESIMFTYIRGISTEKGAKVLEDFISEYRRNRIE